MANKKTCFIICELDKPDSDKRNWADFVRKNIVEPVAIKCDYEKPARADDPNIGLLMSNIIEQMFEADLVVADLTYYNPNVFFELGIRHCAQKPVIHLINAGVKVPFDIEENKAIFVDRDYEKVISAQTEIKQRIEAIQQKPTQFHSFVQQYIQLKQLKLFEKSQTGKDEILKILVESVTTLMKTIGLQTGMIRDLKDAVVKPKHPSYSDYIGGITSYNLGTLLTGDPPKPSQENDQKQ